jgi:hypothetical protein
MVLALYFEVNSLLTYYISLMYALEQIMMSDWVFGMTTIQFLALHILTTGKHEMKHWVIGIIYIMVRIALPSIINENVLEMLNTH